MQVFRLVISTISVFHNIDVSFGSVFRHTTRTCRHSFRQEFSFFAESRIVDFMEIFLFQAIILEIMNNLIQSL